MDVLHARQQAIVAAVLAALTDPPGYSAVRALLRILEEKGHVKHRREGARNVYLPRVSHGTASHSALKRVLSTFFRGSVNEAVATLLDVSDTIAFGPGTDETAGDHHQRTEGRTMSNATFVHAQKPRHSYWRCGRGCSKGPHGMRPEQEQECDDLVLKMGVRPSECDIL